jgi:hypothetical protein
MERVRSKLWNVRMKFYIRSGLVVASLTHYFYVYKDFVSDKEFDIRMIYDPTGCGLNAAVLAPSFWMPTASTALRRVSFYSHCEDGDLGEIFLNFLMDPELRPYAGVDLRTVREVTEALNATKGGPEFLKNWGQWKRLFMGFRPSPYLEIQYLYCCALQFAVGDRRSKTNPMRWDKIWLNLPGSPKYNPSLPMVMKWNQLAERIAGNIVTFVDDLRLTGYSIENAWAVARNILSQLQYLGIQDSPRKRLPPSQSPGAWAGAIVKFLQRKSQSL